MLFTKWVFLGLAVVLALIWEQTQSTRLGYRVERARTAVQAQDNLNAYLRMELQRGKAPAQLMEQARRRLKLEPPTPAQIVVLTDTPAGKPTGLLARLFGNARF